MSETKLILNQLDEKLEKMEYMLLHSELTIHEHCMELKQEVQLDKESKIVVLNEKLINNQDDLMKSIDQIEESAEEILGQIQTYQKECLNELKTKSTKIDKMLQLVRKKKQMHKIFLSDEMSQIGFIMFEAFEKDIDMNYMVITNLVLKNYRFKYIKSNDVTSYSVGYLAKQYFLDLNSECIQDLDSEFEIDKDFELKTVFINHDEMKIEYIFYLKDSKLFVKYKKDNEYLIKEICNCKYFKLAIELKEYFFLSIINDENEYINLTVDSEFNVIARYENYLDIFYCDDKYIYEKRLSAIKCYDQHFNQVNHTDCVPFQSNDPQNPFYIDNQLQIFNIEKSMDNYIILTLTSTTILDANTGLVKNIIKYKRSPFGQPRVVSNTVQCTYLEQDLMRYVSFDLEGRIKEELTAIVGKSFYINQHYADYILLRNKKLNKLSIYKYK